MRRLLTSYTVSSSFLIYFLISIYGCTYSDLDTYKNPEKHEAVIVSKQNSDFIIEQPATFSWLPESIKIYAYSRSHGFPIEETFQRSIAELLTKSGYEFKQPTDNMAVSSDLIRQGTTIRPKDLITVKNWRWAGVNFGAGEMLREITFDNRSIHTFKDLKLKIDYLGTMGPKEGFAGPTAIFFIHDILPAQSEKKFNDIVVGFRHPDAKQEKIRVLNAKTVINDLLIGYVFVLEGPLNDEYINRKNGIIKVPSGENEVLNEYEKGTVIVDVVDAKSRVLVWRGALQARVNFDDPEDKTRKSIELAIQKLVNKFNLSNQ